MTDTKLLRLCIELGALHDAHLAALTPGSSFYTRERQRLMDATIEALPTLLHAARESVALREEVRRTRNALAEYGWESPGVAGGDLVHGLGEERREFEDENEKLREEKTRLREALSRANALYGESCEEKTRLDASNAALRSDVATLREAMRAARDVAADRQLFVAQGPRGFARAVAILDAALAATEPKP